MQERTRGFDTSNRDMPRRDSQILGIIGELSTQLAAAEEMVHAIGREFDNHHFEAAPLSAQRASVLVPRFVLDICTRIFDTLGVFYVETLGTGPALAKRPYLGNP